MIETIAILAVVVPLIVAALMAAFASALPKRTVEVAAPVVAGGVTALCAVVLFHSVQGTLVSWFAGWRPHRGVALGISLAIDPIGAGIAVLAAFLATAGLVFSWRLFEEIEGHRYTILMLVFLAAMVGFSLTGDLFNLFVFFELMGVAAYALTGTRIEEPGPLQGAINFAVINSLGGFLLLLGVGLLYARTGALNLAQIGATVSGRAPDGLMVVGFTLVTVGLFVKAAVVPFHFWLADAHAVAPTPVCVLFSGAMVELGLYGAARVYWTVFAGPFGPHQGRLGTVLVAAGALTAVLGAVLALAQQHLKRLLAFSTVSHVGLFLLGLGLFDHEGMAGTAAFVLSHGLVKGALFLVVGILLHRLGSVDEERLRGRARGPGLAAAGAMFALGGLALAELPPFGTNVGKTLIEDAALRAGYAWAPWLFGVTSALTGGAVLRGAGRMFLGWGPREHDRFASERFGEEEEKEARLRTDRTPLTMIVPTAALLAGALALGVLPGMPAAVERAAARFQDREAYVQVVLAGRAVQHTPVTVEPPTPGGTLFGAASAAGAVAVALVALFRRRLASPRVRRGFARVVGPAVLALRRMHSGHAGDYAAWLVVGLAAMGGLFALALR